MSLAVLCLPIVLCLPLCRNNGVTKEVKVAKFMCATLHTERANRVNHTLGEKYLGVPECIDISLVRKHINIA